MPILRDNLLAGRTLAGNVTGALRDALVDIGAALAEPGDSVDALVHDGRAAFGDGGRDALQAALEAMWDAIAAVATASLIPAGRGGKIVLIAPEADAGEYVEAARSAIENLARTLSTEWARYGITTTALAPGAGTRETDLATLVAFLLSEAGDYYSGTRLELGRR